MDDVNKEGMFAKENLLLIGTERTESKPVHGRELTLSIPYPGNCSKDLKCDKIKVFFQISCFLLKQILSSQDFTYVIPLSKILKRFPSNCVSIVFPIKDTPKRMT